MCRAFVIWETFLIEMVEQTRPLLVDVGLKFERAEMQMISWMCGISIKDRRTSKELRRLVAVEAITSGRPRWYVHMMRKSGGLGEEMYGV